MNGDVCDSAKPLYHVRVSKLFTVKRLSGGLNRRFDFVDRLQRLNVAVGPLRNSRIRMNSSSEEQSQNVISHEWCVAGQNNRVFRFHYLKTGEYANQGPFRAKSVLDDPGRAGKEPLVYVSTAFPSNGHNDLSSNMSGRVSHASKERPSS